MPKLTDLTDFTSGGIGANTKAYLVDSDRTAGDQSGGYDFDSPTGTGATLPLSKFGSEYNDGAPSTATTVTLSGDQTSINSFGVHYTQGAATQPVTDPVSTQEGGVAWNNSDEFQMVVWVSASGLKHKFSATAISTGGGSAGVFEYQTEISASQNLTVGDTDPNKVTPVNTSSGDITLTVTAGTWAADQLLVFERQGDNAVEFVNGSGVIIRGVRNIDNKYFINNNYSQVALICRGTVDGNLEFTIVGRLTSGGATVTTSSYSSLPEGGTAVDVTVIGTGFSANMQDPVLSANATFNSWAYISNTEITINMDAVGLAASTVTVTYDNGEKFIDTDAITIAAATTYLFDSYPFEVGYGLFKMKSTQTYGIRVRRSSDNAEVDVEFDGNNKISLTSTVSAGGNLTTWAGSDDVYIVKKYNQGSFDATFDWTAAADTNEPQLLSSGALIQQGGRTFAEYDGTDDFMNTTGTHNWANSTLSVFAGVRFKSLASNTVINAAYTASPNRNFQLFGNATGPTATFLVVNAGISGLEADSGTIATGTNYQIAAWKGATEFRVSVNGTLGTAEAVPTDYNLSQQLTDGAVLTGGAPFNGYKDYDVIYTSDESANATAIEALISNFI